MTLPFEEDDDSVSSKFSLKENKTKSMFEKKEVVTKQEFSKQVDEIVEKRNDNKQRIIDTVLKFKKMFNDKTLVSNKSPMFKQLETDNLKEFLEMVSDLNKDENEEESAGAVVAISLLLPYVLQLKDRVNELEYKISLLENKK